MRRFSTSWREHVLWSPEGDGGGGGAADKGGGGAADKGGAGSFQLPEGFPAELKGANDGETFGKVWGEYQKVRTSPFELPKDLPDNLKGKDHGETFAKVHDAYKQFHGKVSQQGTVPDKPEAYTFKPSDAVKDYFPDNDPGMAALRTVAHKHKLSQQQFEGLVGDFAGELQKAGQLPPRWKPEQEIVKLADALDIKDPAERKTKVDGMVRDAEAVAGILGEQMKLPPAAKAELDALPMFAGGVMLLDALRQHMKIDASVKVGGQRTDGSGWTKETIGQAQQDPRYNPSHEKYDPNYVKEVKEAYAKLYRDEEAAA